MPFSRHAVVVLNVPTSCSLGRVEAVASLSKDLALAMSLAANRVVPEDEADGKDSTACKPDIVAAAAG